MFEAVGLNVSRLIRTRFGAVQLPRTLARGRHYELAPEWVQAWIHDLGINADEVRSGKPAGGGKPHGAGKGGKHKSGARGGGGGAKQPSRQPDPMTSTVNYIAAGGLPGMQRPLVRPRRGKVGRGY